MNIRKPIDYSAMFTALDTLIAANLPQMELCWEIGKLVSARPEKGAAVAAAEYLCGMYPDASGFSPRNLRRMREFYRTYENAPDVLAQAMTIGWTQNVVILEAGLTLPEQAWYIQAVHRFGWSKLELQRKIAANAHLEIALDFMDEICYTEEQNASMKCAADDKNSIRVPRQYLQKPDDRVRDEGSGEASGAGGPIPNRLRRHQHRGDWQSGLPSCPPETGGAWDQLHRKNRPAAHKGRLYPERSPDWDGPGQHPQHEPHLRRRPRWKNQAATGLHGPPRRCRRPLVHGRLRRHLAGRAGGLSETTGECPQIKCPTMPATYFSGR